MRDQHTLDLLGKTLGELSPMIEEAVRVLNQPGTRALRRKLDGKFHFAVFIYGTLCRMDVPDCDRSTMDLPHYERATSVWPGRVAHEAKRQHDRVACAMHARCHGLQVVVDNTKPKSRRSAPADLTDGGAA